MVYDDPIMETPSSHPNLLKHRLRFLHQTPVPNHGAQESNDIDFTPVVAGPSSVIFSDTPVARLRALLAHPSSSPSRRYPLTRPGRNNSGMSGADVTPIVDRAGERHKNKMKSLGDNECDKPISPPSSLLRESGSPIQIRALASTSAASFRSVPDSPLKSSESGSKDEEQTMPPSSTHGTQPLTSSTSQDGPEVETHEADVTPVRVDEDSFAHLNYTTMKTPRSSGARTVTSLPHVKSLHVRTPAPPGAWMSTTTQNWSDEQSKFGFVRTKKNILKVRFDVTESEASTAEVEHQVPITDMPMSTPNSLPNSHASRSRNINQTRINGSSQGGAVDKPVLARLVTPGRHMTPASRTNASSRPQRKAFIVKVVDAFGRESVDELPIPIVNERADAGDVIRASPSTKTRTPRVSNKNKINVTGREDVPECSSVLHDNLPICHAAGLARIRQTLQEWASGLSDEDRPPDNLALNPSYSKELEERSRVARRSRNQLARTLRIESVKECKRNLIHKYTKEAEDRSGLLPTITGENGSFHRDLVWVGVLLQIVFVLAMWRFAHVQARHLFCAVYYDPLYPDLNPHIGGRAWERWAERPNAETWPPA
ncbi:hypothetical protein F4604DRAFT_406565 [Suillus subluteus]|nr:hypothetical protein F4604DRAFT_406565 [Suillus subluteus]